MLVYNDLKFKRTEEYVSVDYVDGRNIFFSSLKLEVNVSAQ
jgi:hypothetical protein